MPETGLQNPPVCVISLVDANQPPSGHTASLSTVCSDPRTLWLSTLQVFFAGRSGVCVDTAAGRIVPFESGHQNVANSRLMSAPHIVSILDRLPQRTLDLLPAGVFVVTVPDGHIVQRNQRAMELCGGAVPVCLTELLRSVPSTTTIGSSRADSIAAALETGSAIDDVEAVLTAASRSTPVSVSIQPIRENGERAIAALVMCHRVVQREVDRRKDEFLAVLGHELRNPLGAILTAVRMLQLKGPPEPQLQKLRDTILRQTLQLSKLVDDLLDVGRIDTGKLRLDKQRVELNAIVKDAVDACTSLIDERHHTLTVVLSPTPVIVEVDGARIVQVICNLLNNAAKYQKEGGHVEVTASAESGAAVIRVRDDGVGIAPEMIDRIFERFVQIGSSQHRDLGGLGIGLSLVKAVVELHGGSVQARSAGVGRGSEFVVTLPVAPPQP